MASTQPSTCAASTVAAFRRTVESGDTDGVLATFSDDVTDHDAAMFRPYQGLDVVHLLVPHLLAT